MFRPRRSRSGSRTTEVSERSACLECAHELVAPRRGGGAGLCGALAAGLIVAAEDSPRPSCPSPCRRPLRNDCSFGLRPSTCATMARALLLLLGVLRSACRSRCPSPCRRPLRNDCSFGLRPSTCATMARALLLLLGVLRS